MIEFGMIHGRFQPFHNGHFLYLKNALYHANKLVIGITNPEPGHTVAVDSDSHRHLPEANPFSYYQRMQMIQDSILSDEKLSKRYPDIQIVPFPINKPSLWKHYLPHESVVHLVAVLEPWDEEKIELFKAKGFEVKIILDKRHMSGTEIRDDLRNSRSYEKKVPIGTKKILDQISNLDRDPVG